MAAGDDTSVDAELDFNEFGAEAVVVDVLDWVCDGFGRSGDVDPFVMLGVAGPLLFVWCSTG
jgi:hypothetical protein